MKFIKTKTTTVTKYHDNPFVGESDPYDVKVKTYVVELSAWEFNKAVKKFGIDL